MPVSMGAGVAAVTSASIRGERFPSGRVPFASSIWTCFSMSRTLLHPPPGRALCDDDLVQFHHGERLLAASIRRVSGGAIRAAQGKSVLERGLRHAEWPEHSSLGAVRNS